MTGVAVHAWHARHATGGQEVEGGHRRASTATPETLATVPRMEPTQHDVNIPTRPMARGGNGAAGRRGRGQVRAIARAAGRTCSRPGCDTPAAATLVFSYAERVARLVDLVDELDPQVYDLCPAHADRTRPPVGWELTDTRPPASDAPRRLEDEETVEVLAAALRGDAPPTRVSVVEGGREDEPATEDDATAAVAPEATGEEDPLRAALEELQRIATPDDEAPTMAAPATPLRRPDTATHVETPVPPPPGEMAAPTGPPPPPPDLDQGEPTLW